MTTLAAAILANVATPVVAVAPAVTEVFRAERRTAASPRDDSPEALSAYCAERLYDLRAVEGELLLTEAQIALCEEKFNVVLAASQQIHELHWEGGDGRIGPYWRRCPIAEALAQQYGALREEWQRARDVRHWATMSPEAIAYAAREW